MREARRLLLGRMQGGCFDHLEAHAQQCFLAHTSGQSADAVLIEEKGWVEPALVHEIQVALAHSAPWVRATLQELVKFGADYTIEQAKHQTDCRMGAQNLSMCWFAPCGLRCVSFVGLTGIDDSGMGAGTWGTQ